MDAHDELFYRLNDPDPHTQVMAEVDLLYKIFGGNFVERWLAWNGFECEPRSCLRQLARSEARTARCSLRRLRASETAERSLWYPSMPEGRFVRTRESEALYWQRAASVAPSLENGRVSSANDHSNTAGTMKVEGGRDP